MISHWARGHLQNVTSVLCVAIRAAMHLRQITVAEEHPVEHNELDVLRDGLVTSGEVGLYFTVLSGCLSGIGQANEKRSLLVNRLGKMSRSGIAVLCSTVLGSGSTKDLIRPKNKCGAEAGT